jgi:hypothetical protein
MAGLSAIGGTNIRTVDRGYSCPADALLLGWVLRVSLCTAAAPLSARPDAPKPLLLPGLVLLPIGCGCLFYRLCFREWLDIVLTGMWPAGLGRDGRGPAAATTAMWPAVLTGGRPSPEAAGQLPAGSALALCRSASGGNMIRSSGRPPAGGGQTKGSGWMRPRRSHGQLPERSRGELQGT